MAVMNYIPIVERMFAMFQESPPPKQYDLLEVRNEIPNALTRRPGAPNVSHWMSADLVGKSLMDRGPSTSHGHFKLLTTSHTAQILRS
jgi:hypothetical protein